MLKIETFNDALWYCFAGAECFTDGNPPLFAEKDGDVYVADKAGILVVDEDCEETQIIRFENLTHVTQDQARAMLTTILQG